MISDVLFEAVEEIRRYQEHMPESYEGLERPIENVITVVDALRLYLDAYPVAGEDPDYDGLRNRIHEALHNLDATSLRQACVTLRQYCR